MEYFPMVLPFSGSKQHHKLQEKKKAKKQNKEIALNLQTHFNAENSLFPYL